jgi:polyferredoxin
MSQNGPVSQNKGLFLFLTFGLGIIGSLMWIIPNLILDGPPGIKNDGVYHSSATNRGWIGIATAVWLIGFYIVLYFYPWLMVESITVADPVKGLFIAGQQASQWFLYGMLYVVAMVVMGIRMYIKYRHNKYQMVRTTSVLFFQIIFAFLLVEILPIFGLPGKDLKNAMPLDYTFLYKYNVEQLLDAGMFGLFLLIWGFVLALIVVPTLVYFYGKRWYCSWVCGCGGLAETLGDPYRQLSNKKMWAWKLERWLVHGVLVFAGLLTIWVGWHTLTALSGPDGGDGQSTLLGISAYNLRDWYGFLIGSIFAGVIGTGFYPYFGNRSWCRFGCPLAAYMGIVQRFKSRFRITTNGGQCISCGNCSTYCEQGIDVRAYAQKGQNIVRASCVGCGVCSAVCPRGVLKLENGPEEGRFGNEGPIVLGNDGFKIEV